MKVFCKDCPESYLGKIRESALDLGWEVVSYFCPEDFYVFLCVFTPEKDRILVKTN